MPDWVRDAEGLALRLPLDGQPHLLRADFLRGPMGYRLAHGGGRGQAVARAVGLKKGRAAPRVVDATAGLARDAFLLAWLGCTVTALERQAEIHALVADALARAEADAEVAARLGGRLRLLHADARDWLQACAARPPEERPEVVYLDPMHPDRAKSAAVRKEMRLFRALVGEDPDAPALFESARAAATRRVVVKRPRQGAPLAPEPSHQQQGRSTRFDVYLLPRPA